MTQKKTIPAGVRTERGSDEAATPIISYRISTSPAPLADRLERRSVLMPNGCIIWQGVTRSNGYPQIWNGERMVSAHRIAFQLAYGPIPAGLELGHLCHDFSTCLGGPTCLHRRCVNPQHLEAQTHAENSRFAGYNRRVANAARKAGWL